MIDDIKYEDWKTNANRNPVIQEKGDIIVNKREYEKLSKMHKFKIFRDSFLIFLLIVSILMISLYFFYPDRYKDIITSSPICNPFTNITIEKNINNFYNNVTCNNVCPEFPDKLKIYIINGSI